MKKKQKSKNESEDNKFNFDNDYFIGTSDNKKEKINENGKSNKKHTSDTFGKLHEENKVNNKKIIEKERKNARRKMITRIVLLVLILIFIFVCLAISPIFNVEDIEVKGNSKVSSERIISVSEIKKYKNMFLFKKSSATKKILQTESYIESVKIKRNIPNKITIYVEEREPILQIKLEDDTYVYVNNQGYVVQFSENKLDKVPVIKEVETDLINLKTKENTIRLNENDLNSIGIILKIMSIMKDYEIDSYIEGFDISNTDDLIIFLNQKNKKVHFGSCSDLNTRILYLKKILEDTKNEKGEIFINGNLNDDYIFFRKEV
ncbi:MAG: FtsQ-type POTRA domain-containing protein [Clostridia bacterium]|nr:FtsQ-type POTRA domain-containing protein [Clostridia bacterium]